MTRINLVDPAVLTNQHLMAEYKEITRIFTVVTDRIKASLAPPSDAPSDYVLGTGHVKFFYDKCKFILNRYNELRKELQLRDYDLNLDMFYDIVMSVNNNIRGTVYFNDYSPKPENIYLNMARLCKRSKLHDTLQELSNG